MELWTKAVEEESQRAITYNLHLEALRAGGGVVRPLILLVDSITESYLGSSYGEPQDRFADVPAVLKTEYANFEPLVLGISGDQTQHLLWRLMNGGILPEYASDPNAVFVVLIGTNNIGSGEEPGAVNQALRTLAQYLLEEVKGRIIFVELLSRGDVFHRSDLKRWFSGLAEARSLFDFSAGGTAQPLLNQLVAAQGLSFCNLTQQRRAEGPREPGSWAGSQGFRRRGDVLYDRDLPGETVPRVLYDYRVRDDSMMAQDGWPNHPALLGWLIQHHYPKATQGERDILTTLFQNCGQSIARVAAGQPDHLPPAAQPEPKPAAQPEPKPAKKPEPKPAAAQVEPAPTPPEQAVRAEPEPASGSKVARLMRKLFR